MKANLIAMLWTTAAVVLALQLNERLINPIVASVLSPKVTTPAV